MSTAFKKRQLLAKMDKRTNDLSDKSKKLQNKVDRVDDPGGEYPTRKYMTAKMDHVKSLGDQSNNRRRVDAYKKKFGLKEEQHMYKQALLESVIEESPVDTVSAFDKLVREKIEDLIELKKIQLSETLFNENGEENGRVPVPFEPEEEPYSEEDDDFAELDNDEELKDLIDELSDEEFEELISHVENTEGNLDEDVEQLDELSHKTLRSYIKKAKEDKSNPGEGKYHQRLQGLEKARDRTYKKQMTVKYKGK